MKGKDDERVRRVERAWEGTRLETEALARAYEQIDLGAAPGEFFRQGCQRQRRAALLLAQGGERCPK